MGGGKGNNRIRVVVDTLGCKLNQSEGELLARQFAEAGCQLVAPTDECDVYILNTCTVTHIADRKSRHRLRLARRRNLSALLVATGCYAERAPQELSRITGVNLVIGNEKKPQLRRLLEEGGGIKSPDGPAGSCPYDGSRTRAFIKVQDGCHSSCSYCIVPLVRRREESLPPEQVMAEVQHRLAAGYKEVLLTGVKIGSYHHNGVRLKGLLERILSETEVTRLRLSSLQPAEISPELILLWRDPRLCRQFHLSLQSGSDTVLCRMKRRYSTEEYLGALSLVRSLAPEAAITTDIMVGFPGETDREFEESYEFCRKLGFARIHVFPYSPRPGTEAARRTQTVADTVKKERALKMLALAQECARNFSQQFIGRTMPVLWEKQDQGIWSGLTDNYLKIYARSRQDLTNRLLLVKLSEVRGDGIWGEIQE